MSTLYTLTSFLGVSMDSLFVTDEEDASPVIPPERPASPTSVSTPTFAENGIVQRRNTRPHIYLAEFDLRDQAGRAGRFATEFTDPDPAAQAGIPEARAKKMAVARNLLWRVIRD